MVEMLVREFVPQALAAGLDFSRLQRVNTKFHTGRRSARRREGDVIWRLPTRGDGSDIYLYLLLEFQSSDDWWMSVRAQIYQGLLWQQVIDEHKLKAGARLPPLLLLVIYNGLAAWKAPTQTRELIALSPDSPLWSWQPQVRYYLLDTGAFPGDELARRRSLVALLFRLERPLAPKELERLRGEVSGWFRRHPDHGRLRSLFAELVRQAFKGLGVKVPQSIDLLEMKMKSNLATIGETWRQQALIQGRVEGKAEALVCLLVERFGTLAPSLRTRIRRARLATLDRWFKRAIAAPDLRSVFNAPR
jgi:Putative transposase, YhgA-like